MRTSPPHASPRAVRAAVAAALAVIVAGLVACSPQSPGEGRDAAATAPDGAPNVLLVVLDDVSVEELTTYGVGSDCPSLPTIEALAARGTVFTRAWTNPVCSPTRATILTGRYSRRTGIGQSVKPNTPALEPSEVLLPAMLPESYSSAMIGKWHLSNREGGLDAPERHGFDYFAGHLHNFTGTDTYSNWIRVESGTRAPSTDYVTSVQVSDAAAWIATARAPWLCVLSFTAGHSPWDEYPPEGLHTEPPLRTKRSYYKAALEAADAELGRLLEGVDLTRTLVIVLGDNGTPKEVVERSRDPEQAKGSVYEGGIHVPLIVAGPGVAVGRSSALVHSVDLAATIVELCGGDASTALDSVSFAPCLADPAAMGARHFLFAEFFRPNGPGPYEVERCAVRGERFKLLRLGLHDRLVDLEADPGERENLVGDERYARVLAELGAELDRLRALR
ncbi:sulfatase-like hydrolase/transferase [Engelhardtia mirabilis]|uniref:Choline-sulfatase n=1 Tax=Engelhardtia mirabilis TaxID=2528011 RepID=A0A518BEU9_9BACT|nr:Choline-sulfatase [Planctomycetes bacterium Pla133]QDU99830.1 Choline-sulfatase [Planctomycetes bacterium Pla86]